MKRQTPIEAIIDAEQRGSEYQVTLLVGVQKFNVGPLWDVREEAERYADMLQGALYAAGCGPIQCPPIASLPEFAHLKRK